MAKPIRLWGRRWAAVKKVRRDRDEGGKGKSAGSWIVIHALKDRVVFEYIETIRTVKLARFVLQIKVRSTDANCPSREKHSDRR